MQKNCYLNGRPYLKAKSTPFSRFAIFCMSEIVFQIVHRVIATYDEYDMKDRKNDILR